MSKALFSQVLQTLKQENNGRDKVLAHCPAHDDKNKSLSVALVDDELLLHCFAGCSFEAVKMALQARGVNFAESKKVRDKIEKTYDYKLDGKLCYQKVRRENKKFSFRRLEGGKWVYKLGDQAKILYNADALAKADIIYICEGEKDADTLVAHGFCATTNCDGGANWSSSYNECLRGKEIYIVEDNDDTGRFRTELLKHHLSLLAKEIHVISFPELPEHGDVTDYIIAEGVEKFLVKMRNAERMEKIKFPAPQKKQTKNTEQEKNSDESEKVEKRKEAAEYEDYVAFMKSICPVNVRDILSGELMTEVPHGTKKRWKPTLNMEKVFRSHARAYGKFYKAGQFSEHIMRWEYEETPRLRIEIPRWDGRDRLKEICDKLSFKEFTPTQTWELFAQWGAGIFNRLEMPSFQNVCPIIQGYQGAGKDTLIDALTKGLGDYTKNLEVRQNKIEETIKQLHTALVFVVSEFDRVSKIENSTLKQFLTQATSDMRLSYDPRAEQREIRASFIASCNPADVFQDDSGTRRFWFLEAEYLGFETIISSAGKIQGAGLTPKTLIYPGHFADPHMAANRSQIQAQFKALAAQDYRADPKTILKAELITLEKAPESVEELLLQNYDKQMELLLLRETGVWNAGRRGLEFEAVVELLEKIGKRYSRSVRSVCGVLKRKNRSKRVMGGMIYFAGDGSQNREIDLTDDDIIF